MLASNAREQNGSRFVANAQLYFKWVFIECWLS